VKISENGKIQVIQSRLHELSNIKLFSGNTTYAIMIEWSGPRRHIVDPWSRL